MAVEHNQENVSNLPFNSNASVIEDFFDYYSDRFKEVHKLVRERKYTIGDTSASYRNLSYWKELGVLPDGVLSQKGWNKFNLIEFVWVEIVKKLRAFGLSTEAILNIKKYNLNWDKENQTYLWFEYFVIKAKVSDMDAYLVTLPDGDSHLVFSRYVERDKLIFGSRSFILISIKEILQSMKIKSPIPEILFSLSQPELDVIDSIRHGNVDNISVKLKNGKVIKMDLSKTISGSDIQKIKKEIESAGDFAEITAKFEAGKEQSATVIRKKKY